MEIILRDERKPPRPQPPAAAADEIETISLSCLVSPQGSPAALEVPKRNLVNDSSRSGSGSCNCDFQERPRDRTNDSIKVFGKYIHQRCTWGRLGLKHWSSWRANCQVFLFFSIVSRVLTLKRDNYQSRGRRRCLCLYSSRFLFSYDLDLINSGIRQS